MKSYHNQRRIALIFRYVLLAILAVLWIFPIIWIILASFSYLSTTILTLVQNIINVCNYRSCLRIIKITFPLP